MRVKGHSTDKIVTDDVRRLPQRLAARRQCNAVEAAHPAASATRAALRTVGVVPAPVAITDAATTRPDQVKKTLVIFGATGNLTATKLMPALLHLEAAGLLHADTRIVGTSRQSWTSEQFVAHVKEQLAKEPQECVDAFLARLSYLPTADAAGYDTLAATLKATPSAEAPGECVFYPAVPDLAVKGIWANLARVGLLGKEGAAAKNRLVLEKPVGTNGEAAHKVQELLADFVLPENQAPVDHYPGKRVARAILPIRAQFESVWNHAYISRVEVRHSETQGIRDRGQYFDEMGILRDMVQSHLLQLVALVGMELPTVQTGEVHRANKVQFLESLRHFNSRDVKHNVLRGEYFSGRAGGETIPDYIDEKGVSKRSRTETYVRIRAESTTPRWQQVPFCISAGKAMPENTLEVNVSFRSLPARLLPQSLRPPHNDRSGPATLSFHIQPKPAVLLTVDGKTVDLAMPASEDLTDYSAVLYDVMSKDPKLTLHFDEIFACWGFIDTIVRAWSADRDSVFLYMAGTRPVAVRLAEREEELAQQLRGISLALDLVDGTGAPAGGYLGPVG